jgi:ankyrin repeat protein
MDIWRSFSFLLKVELLIQRAIMDGLLFTQQRGMGIWRSSSVEKGAVNKDTCNYGETPLHSAAGNGHLAVVQFVVASGADYNTNGINGWTPLQSAAGNGHLAVVEFLIDTGADINRQESNYGWTPFHSAAVNGHLAVVEFLIKKGADINTKGNNGWTPLQSASGHGHQAVVELINRRGAEVKSRNMLN